MFLASRRLGYSNSRHLRAALGRGDFAQRGCTFRSGPGTSEVWFFCHALCFVHSSASTHVRAHSYLRCSLALVLSGAAIWSGRDRFGGHLDREVEDRLEADGKVKSATPSDGAQSSHSLDFGVTTRTQQHCIPAGLAQFCRTRVAIVHVSLQSLLPR